MKYQVYRMETIRNHNDAIIGSQAHALPMTYLTYACATKIAARLDVDAYWDDDQQHVARPVGQPFYKGDACRWQAPQYPDDIPF